MPEQSSVFARECSPFLNTLINRQPGWFEALKSSGRLDKTSTPNDASLNAHIAEKGLDIGLRTFRNQEMMRIIWRDLNRLCPLTETMADLSTLAEVCLQTTTRHHTQGLVKRYGTPRDHSGLEQGLVIIALGKLGGNELNLSSDIDIVFTFPHGGECDGKGKLSNEQFFIKLARLIVRSLSEVSEHGFCFRVDTRLRPFGESGPLVSSFVAMEQYYQREGRDWERYALVKARVVTGDQKAGGGLLKSLAPFVYRRYIDFGAVETLHEMYRSLREDAKKQNRANDIKRGGGGIREIEFLVQAFQLLRGGRDLLLQSTSLLNTLQSLESLQILPAAAARSLQQAYEFLRNLENAIQALHDQQTHTVPEGEDLLRVARVMRFSSAQELHIALIDVRKTVSDQIGLCFPAQTETVQTFPENNLWSSLKAGDWPETHKLKPVFTGFLSSLSRYSLSNRAANRLDEFMPILLSRLEESKFDAQVISDVLNLVLAICQRSAYLSLLVQNPPALGRMLSLFAKSDWVARIVMKYPALLDELIDPGLGQLLPTRQEMEQTFARKLGRKTDIESALLSLNYLKLAFSLRIAVAELDNTLSPREVPKSLSQLAGVILQNTLDLALNAVNQKHGFLDGPGLAVIAYGSLGAKELSYGSDLDLMFLYKTSDAVSDGSRPLEAERFHTAVVRRLLSFLTSPTASGRLFEVDTRLRPNGRSGFLVSSLAAFENYQKNQAWTWELQALTRARFCAGNSEIGAAFDSIRTGILAIERDPVVLKGEVRNMRQRLREAHSSDNSLRSKFKHAEGGLIDIDFIAQLGVLTIASKNKPVIDAIGTLEQLLALHKADWLSGNQLETLGSAVSTLTSARHLSLIARDRESLNDVDFSAKNVCRDFLQKD